MALKSQSFSDMIKRFTPKSTFTSTLLIFILLVVAGVFYFLSDHKILRTDEDYPLRIVFAVVILTIKAFILSFLVILENLRKQKATVVSLVSVCFAAELGFSFFAIQNLTETTYLKYSILAILGCNVAFLIQIILGGISKVYKLTVVSVIIYSIFFVCIDMLFFDSNMKYYSTLSSVFTSIKFSNTVSNLTVLTELIALLATTKAFLTKLKEE